MVSSSIFKTTSSHGKAVLGDAINNHSGTEFDYVGTKGQYLRLKLRTVGTKFEVVFTK